jgi:hypothetical protein
VSRSTATCCPHLPLAYSAVPRRVVGYSPLLTHLGSPKCASVRRRIYGSGEKSIARCPRWIKCWTPHFAPPGYPAEAQRWGFLAVPGYNCRGKVFDCNEQIFIIEARAAQEQTIYSLSASDSADCFFTPRCLLSVAEENVIVLAYAACSTPRPLRKKGLELSGTTKPRVPVRCVARPRAILLGR